MSLLQERREDRIEEIFDELSAWVHDVAGIVLPRSKIGLVRSRLQKRLRETGFDDFPSWFTWVRSGNEGEFGRILDLLTTNKTHFWREPAHFEFLAGMLDHPPLDAPRLQLWSAGCSSGEEPYTLSALLQRSLPAGRGFRILATDLSTRVLERARAGEYAAAQARDVPPELHRALFETGHGPEVVRVRATVRGPVSLARLNLLEPWPMRRPFQAIFCRNVMIYFDHATRTELVRRFATHLAPGGFLFVGHSESLNGLDHDLRYVRPAVYRRD